MPISQFFYEMEKGVQCDLERSKLKSGMEANTPKHDNESEMLMPC